MKTSEGKTARSPTYEDDVQEAVDGLLLAHGNWAPEYAECELDQTVADGDQARKRFWTDVLRRMRLELAQER